MTVHNVVKIKCSYSHAGSYGYQHLKLCEINEYSACYMTDKQNSHLATYYSKLVKY